MTSLRFQAKIEINGINPFVPVDAEQAARLREGWRKPMPVLVQVNGAPAEPWRINMDKPLGNLTRRRPYIQGGVGRPFSLRNSGLNSLD